MPKIKKANPKKSNVARSSKGTSKYTFKIWHAMAGLALFIAGGFIVAYSQASADYSVTKEQLPLIQYEESGGGVVIEKNGDTPKLIQGPRTIRVTKSGELYCFDTNQDQGKKRDLSKIEVDQLLSDLRNSGISQLPSPTDKEGGISTKMLRYIDQTTGQIINIDLENIQTTSPGYTTAMASLQNTCATATQPTSRDNNPEIRRNPTAPTSMRYQNIRRSLISTAQASASDPRIQWVSRFNEVMRWNIQNARLTSKLPAYTLEGCLGLSASNWSNTMASYYNANPAYKMANPSKMIWHSNMTSVIVPTCGNNWRALGENVGWGYAVNSGKSADEAAGFMFNQYMNSQAHRDAILATKWNLFGVGSILSTDGKIIWNTTHFMAR
jgi:uncharacterized protein YkwD